MKDRINNNTKYIVNKVRPSGFTSAYINGGMLELETTYKPGTKQDSIINAVKKYKILTFKDRPGVGRGKLKVKIKK